MDVRARHLRLLTETIEAVNSTLDLEEVLGLVARKVADALGADACFVYLYDERDDELVLRATHGTSVEEMTKRPRLPLGQGITGIAAAEREPVMIPAEAHLDPASAVPEPAGGPVPVDPGGADPSARQARGRAQRPHDRAARVHAGGDRVARRDRGAGRADDPARADVCAAQRRVAELEALAKISEAVSESLYLEESLEAIVRTTMDALGATGAALVLEDGKIAWPEGRAGRVRRAAAAALERRQIGELVCDRDTPFTDEDRRCSSRSRTTRPSRSSTGAR